MIKRAGWVLLGVFLAGCGSGEITADQQQAKIKALQQVADSQKDPNREVRPQ